ncbi:MAG: pyridoxal-phosphate dependent enzyme [Thermoplasmata archaeon]
MTYGIGDTSLVKAEKIGKEIGARELYLKLEGENPTGTHKDRLAIQHVDDAIIRNHDIITVGSCGNYALAMSFVTCKSSLKCVVFLPKKYTGSCRKTLGKYGAEIHTVEGGYEESVMASREMAEKMGWYDANPGNKNTSTSLVAYVDISEEIQEQLGETPSSTSVPVGNGTTLAGIHLGFRLLWHKRRSTGIPRMIGVSSTGNNSVIESFSKGFKEMVDLLPEDIQETEVNEPLLNWHAYDGQEALNAVYDTDGMAVGLSDQEMLHYQEMLKADGIENVLPVSAAALGGLKRFLAENEIEGKHVIVLTSGVKNVRN